MREPTEVVFLSDASQDVEAARRICGTLRAADLEAWFDPSELRGGEVRDQKTRRRIRECALFAAAISKSTQSPLEAESDRLTDELTDHLKTQAAGQTAVAHAWRRAPACIRVARDWPCATRRRPDLAGGRPAAGHNRMTLLTPAALLTTLNLPE